MTSSTHPVWFALSFLAPAPGLLLGALMLLRAMTRNPADRPMTSAHDALSAGCGALFMLAAGWLSAVWCPEPIAFLSGVMGMIAFLTLIVSFQALSLCRQFRKTIHGSVAFPSLLLLPIGLGSTQDSLPLWTGYALIWLMWAVACGVPACTDRWSLLKTHLQIETVANLVARIQPLRRS